MKLFKFLSAVAIVLATSNAFAWFSVNANCVVNPSIATCHVCNYSYSQAIYCRLDASAQTYWGAWATNYVQGMVTPGNCAYVYLNANNPMMDPLVSANADAQCRF